MTNKKIILNTTAEFKIFQKRYTKEEFFEKFEFSLALSTTLIAEDIMRRVDNTDRALTAEQLSIFN